MQDGFKIEGEKEKEIDLYNTQTYDIDFETHHKGITIKTTTTKNGKPIVLFQRVELGGVFLESKKKYNMQGNLHRESEDEYHDCGEMKFNRYGPAKQKDEEKTPLDDSGVGIAKYKFDSVLPMGHYHSYIVWPQGSDYLLKNSFIVSKNLSDIRDFNIPNISKKISGHLYDEQKNPVSNIQLTLVSTCDGGLKKFVTSKDDGSFEFKDVSIGEYKILLDNKQKAIVVQRGRDVVQDITPEPLWRFNVAFNSSVYGYGELTIKNFKINFDSNEKYSDGEKILSMVYVDSPSPVAIEYGGKFTTYTDLPPLIVYDNGLEFSAGMHISGVATLDPVGSEVINITNGAGLCNGLFPSGIFDKIKQGEKVTFATYGASNCSFTLEPCKNSECEETEYKDDFDDFGDF